MNHRRALKYTTDFGLGIFLFTILGVILWTTDEVLGWNILPDWLDHYAQLLVMVLAILAAFSVVISIMCSLAVMAGAAAMRAGDGELPSVRRPLQIVAGILAGTLLLMYGLHRLDVYRKEQIKRSEQVATVVKRQKISSELRERLREVAGEQGSKLRSLLEKRDEAQMLQLLRALESSLPHAPGVQILFRAEVPYRYTTLRLKNAGGRQVLQRESFMDLPEAWERQVVSDLLAGKSIQLADAMSGKFLNSTRPVAWEAILGANEIIALVSVNADKPVDYGY
ncbi:hypothetical protein [Armatimonas sp.]|uniref:hypothetical protein n=1 Tax=Armatimonas sp. TaxID=1872638 RepID=UPI00286CBCC3|nr:hypothetical protein [Armatimonas sp.]